MSVVTAPSRKDEPSSGEISEPCLPSSPSPAQAGAGAQAVSRLAIQSRSASSIRVCQPLPPALKWSITSCDSRMVVDILGRAAGGRHGERTPRRTGQAIVPSKSRTSSHGAECRRRDQPSSNPGASSSGQQSPDRIVEPIIRRVPVSVIVHADDLPVLEVFQAMRRTEQAQGLRPDEVRRAVAVCWARRRRGDTGRLGAHLPANQGLYDRRLGRVSAPARRSTRWPGAELFTPLLGLAKHFHEKRWLCRSYNWVRLTLQAYRRRAAPAHRRKRPRRRFPHDGAPGRLAP